MATMHKRLFGSAVGLALTVVLTAVMVPERSHLSSATAGLVLVVPVLAGVVAGGFVSGLVSVAGGFVAYDYFFIRPYDTLEVGHAEDWVVLVVYAVVMCLVARVVAGLDEARAGSQAREANARHLLDLSELLLADRPPAEVGRAVVHWARDALALEGVALLLSEGGNLGVIASAGAPFSPEELERLGPQSHLPVPLTTASSQDAVQTLALVSSGRPVGLLVLRNVPPAPAVREVLPIMANHLAIALERAELRQRALRAELLEEVERLRRSLIGAVSHDLRTPLATIKVASTAFLDGGPHLSAEDSHELHALIDMQADRLTRLVDSLLDMSRIQSGALEVRPMAQPMADLVHESLGQLHSALGERTVEILVPDDLPLVDGDPILIVQVLTNLIENANRFGPPGTAVTVSVSQGPAGHACVAVSDRGPGVPEGEREAVFETFVRFDSGGRSGLGLAIAKAFVEAHGEHLWVEEAKGGGARFVFSLPLAPVAVPAV